MLIIKLPTSRTIELWNCMRAGDARALKELHSLFYQYLFSTNFAVCNNREFVKDSIHETFISIWVNRDKLPPVTSVSSYITTCMHRKMIDILKKEAVNTNALLKIDSEYEFAYEEVMIAFQEQEDTRKTLKHALSHLTTKQKEAIRMRFFENKNYGEIALLSLCEQHTVYSHIYEAVARLRYFFKVKHTS